MTRTKKNAVWKRELLALIPAGQSFELSFGVFYGTVSVMALLVAGLLFASGEQVRNIPIPEMTVVNAHSVLAKDVKKMVVGYPIEQMTPFIARQNKITAAFLVSIAKKESNWGKRVPVDAVGRDCFNYWGYRGEGSRGIEMGHGCFGSREEAVAVVGKRIQTFVSEYKFDSPEELVVWKCGWSCDGQNRQSVRKWISDVGFYFHKIYN